MCFIPVLVYAFLILPCKFPVNERVAAKIPYRDMLAQVGAIGFFIFAIMLILGIEQIVASKADGFSLSLGIVIGLSAVIAIVAGGLYQKPGALDVPSHPCHHGTFGHHRARHRQLDARPSWG